METPLYTQSGEFLGYFDDSYLRPLISKQEARVVRKGEDRRVILTATATHRVRALSGSEHGSALSTVATENLYPETPEQLAILHGNKMRPVVTATVLTLKKYRPGIGFVPYGETDGFKRNRFNPDRIRRPLFQTERLAREAMAAV